MEDTEGNDVSEFYYLNFIKKCYGSRYAHANWFQALLSNLEERDFTQIQINPCIFTRNDCIIITCVEDCLIFYKKNEVLFDLIKSLENQFKLIDEGDFASFLGIQFNKIGNNKLE